MTQKAIIERHKRGRKLFNELPIRELQFIEPYSENDLMQLSLPGMKKAASKGAALYQ
jgi:hypothetical protein